MPRFPVGLEKFDHGEEGASIIEYALLLALMTVVCIGAMTILGTKISGFFSSFSTTI